MSLDYVKPLRYELLGVAAVLLLNLPFSLKHKELELPMFPPTRLRGFLRGSVTRTAYLGAALDLGETSLVLPL